MLKKNTHIRFISGAALLIAAAIVLAGCGSQPASPAPAETQAPTVEQVSTNTPSVAATAAQTNEASQAATGGTAASFSKDVLPILETSCVSCHGGEKTSKGLDLKTYTSTMTGSQNGAVLVVGDAAKSKLVTSVQSGKMPKRGPKLTAEQIQLLVDWVNAGALNN